MISPPSRLRSVSRSRRFCVLSSGSLSFQNRCPPRLPGITVNARAADAIRGSLPVASKRPPPTCTAAFIRAAVAGSDGTLLPKGSGSACNAVIVGSVASRVTFGLRSVSTPWPMNTADSRGRAILRINMAAVFPGCALGKPAAAVVIGSVGVPHVGHTAATAPRNQVAPTPRRSRRWHPSSGRPPRRK